MRHNLSKVITARYIRFQPTDWHEQISMRVELYGCYGKVSPQLLHNFKLIVSKYIISTSSSGGRGGGGAKGLGVVSKNLFRPFFGPQFGLKII